MKLSVSLPDDMALEIKRLARRSEQGVSWWLQRAWMASRAGLQGDPGEIERRRRKALKALKTLKGALGRDFPGMDAVKLARSAWRRAAK